MYDSTEKVITLIDNVLAKYQDMVYHLALNQTRNITDAEVIFQEVFLKYVTYIETTQEVPAFPTAHYEKLWLLRSTIESINHHPSKESAHYRTNIDPNILKGIDPANAALYQAVLKLPSNYRLIIHLVYNEDMTTDEICTLLFLKESTIRKHLAKAIRLLKKLLKGDYDYV